MSKMKRIGIVGYGKLGQFMVNRILTEGDHLNIRLAFVWNRTPIHGQLPPTINIVNRLKDLAQFEVDLIVEVCHPDIVKQFGSFFLQFADLLVGSSTALADEECVQKLRQSDNKHRVLIARGALWGANDIERMARQNLLESVRVVMHFHPGSLRLPNGSPLKTINDDLLKQPNCTESRILFEGPVREVCKLAPNNVNTMATAGLIGIGLDKTIGCLVSDLSLTDHHKIVVQVIGIKRAFTSRQFEVNCTRQSPISNESNVSSTQTNDSFWQSILECLAIRIDNNPIYVC